MHNTYPFPSREALKEFERSFLGKTIDIGIDRSIGYVHVKGEKTLVYPINYGYIPNILGGDGEELDVYLLGVNEIVEKYTCRIIAIIHRENDCEDKLVGAPEGVSFSADEIMAAVHFQEKYYNSYVETYK